MKRITTCIIVFVLFPATALTQNWRLAAQPSAKPFTIAELLKVRRVADPQLSPDGRWIAYTITDTDKPANKRTSQIYLVSVQGGDPRRLDSGAGSAAAQRWSPDGRRIAFVSSREGSPQVHTIDVATGELKRVTDISTGVGGPIVWSPDGKWLAFTSDVYPDCRSDDCNRQREEQASQSKVKAKIADRLLYRHWNAWKDGKRSHVLVTSSDGGAAKDLTPGDYDAPPFGLGGPDDFAFSPDSQELAFARNTDKVEALSTNGDVFVVPVAGGSARNVTGDNPANDQSPLYSPDGRYLAYRAQARAGFESDRWQLILFDRKTGQRRSLTEQFDASIEGFSFSPDGQTIYFIAGERGRQPIFSVPAAGGQIKKLINESFNDDVKVTPDSRALVFTRQSLARPIEIFRANIDGTGVSQVTSTNDVYFAEFNLKAAEEVNWEGAGGAKVHGFIVKPTNFTTGKKWPLIVLIHGGPQGAWNDAWSYRWNPQVFAAAGYVVFAPNPRGSTGYGQKFVDEISADWAGKVYTDIMNGVAHVASLGYIDRDRIGAAGGSYGGYMVNWIEGHNDDPRANFKALVSHAGVYNLTSMYGATEELWFPEWEFKGTPWTNPEMYAKWSPHQYVKSFKTPLLVVHGELDYRVPVTEGLQLFTALQRQGVDSKLLYYPDEGHWVLKPQNSELWYTAVLGWFDTYLKPRAQA
jgi:dipeptidyl aminopeptidase/acylaminoacyl peptidase